MACINPDGSLSAVARRTLILLRRPHGLSAAAKALDLPLYRVRATLREISRANLVDLEDQCWHTTPLGEEALTLDEQARALGH